MIGSAPRRTGAGEHRRLAAVLTATFAVALLFVAPRADAAPGRVAATGGCRAVGSGDVPSGGGPDRATVVVDTGAGAVWSACISFSGSISGIEALERAASTITDLDPVYDQYPGIGKAVCKLRGVGTSPPDCLGKTVEYWSLSVNGRVSPVGAGAITIKDGDVEGWRYGTGGTPRAASAGTEAAAAPPPTTTTKPATPTTQPSGGTTQPGGGGLTGSTKPDGSPADPTTTQPGQTTTTAKGQTTTTDKGATTTTTGADGHTTQLAASDGSDGSGGSGKGTESATGAATGSRSTTSSGDGSGSSSVPAIVGFAAVIAAIAGGAVLIRRRRAAAGAAPAA